MISGLQGDFGELDIKYLKKNISKCQSHISGSFRRTPWHCAKWLRNSLGKRYQRIRICLTGEVKTSSSPIRLWDIRIWNVGGRNSSPGGLSYFERRKGDRLCVQGVGTPLLDDTECERLSGSTPSGFPKRTCAAMLSGALHRNDSISYPDMLSGSLTKSE